VAVVIAVASLPASWAADIHVRPDGSPNGTGSFADPVNLETALSGAIVDAGDTVWLHGGVYPGSYTSQLAGSAAAPIEVRAVPGARPRIDGIGSDETTLSLYGAWTEYHGFEVMNSEPDRWGGRPSGLYVVGSHLTLVNLVLHDLGNNGFWSPAENLEVIGCLIYCNGYDDADRGHGHGVYTQNQLGTKVFADNVIFGGYSFGIHAYTEGGHIEGFELVGNTWFDAGVNSTVSGHKDDCLVGGLQPASRIVLRENNGWARAPTERSVRLGYAVPNGDVTLVDNYLVGGLNFAQPWSSISMTGNTVYGSVSGIDPAQYPGNSFPSQRPTGVRVVVRPNPDEVGRALITVYNWDELDVVAVDPSAVLAPGDSYVVRDVENYFGPPAAIGIWHAGPIAVPMDLTATSPVVGSPATPFEHTPREFGVYVLQLAAPFFADGFESGSTAAW
jgi:hypothetical protein